MDEKPTYDLCVIGGGIAGLSLAIQAGKAGIKTVLIEKSTYPKHKVCGEYVSNESRNFLRDLGLDFNSDNYPKINMFKLFDSFDNVSECSLNSGGFGVSRFHLDALLADQAKQSGVDIFEKTAVRSVNSVGASMFEIEGAGIKTSAKLVVGAWGRSSPLQSEKHKTSGEPWIGVKYHLDAGPPDDTIEIHAFEDGYAGVSKVEDGRYCLAYLSKARGLKRFGSNIDEYEREVLCKNAFLRKRLSANRLMGPITTSQFQFTVQEPSEYPIVGDAGGFIPPLTGNGMSLALRSSKHLFPFVKSFLEGNLSFEALLKENRSYVKGYLSSRVQQGVLLQNLLFLRPKFLNQAMMKIFSKSPYMLRTMTKMAVGDTI